MIIIWGFRRKVKNEAILQLACRHGHVAAHRILSARRWFTLFFIPIIPGSKKYFSICTMCGLQLQVPNQDAEAMLAKVVDPTPAPATEVHPPIPAVAGTTSPPAGWYPDPAGAGGQRYWDGSQWTESVQQDESAG